MTNDSNEGYIYVYKCILGDHQDICKIGVTKHLNDNSDRMKQHSRTIYYGLTPYHNFITGKLIYTAFKVKEMKKADKLVQERFKEHQLFGIEIFCIDYNVVIKELYEFLKLHNQFIDIVKDGISKYDFIEVKDYKGSSDTFKSRFDNIRQEILSKYKNELPEELLVLLKDKKDFEENCSSHFKSGNYIIFPNSLVLDIHYNKAKRFKIINKLLELL